MFTGKLEDLTSKIIGAFYKVYKYLGYGFSEKVYENALVLGLKQIGLAVESQKPIQVFYEKCMVGEFFADILVNDSVIVEVKAVKHLLPEHEAQLLNYLKATRSRPPVEFWRKSRDQAKSS